MLVALTGASGFIGSYIARALHASAHQVRALVRSTSRREHIAPYIAEWYEGDQADPQTQAGLTAGVDAVVHNACDFDAVEQGPGPNLAKNVLPSLQLLEAARVAGVEQFIFISSVAAYHEILQDRKLDENHPTWPGSIYGAYKASVEPHLMAYHHAYGMNTSSWRPAAVYGVAPHVPDSQWYDLIVTAQQGGTIDTPHGGKITHVQDIADAVTLAIGDKSVSGQLYNLVDGYMYWQVAAEFAKELSGSNATILDRKGPGPKNQFDTQMAVDFFTRHNHPTALRRGAAGVREYVQDLLRRIA